MVVTGSSTHLIGEELVEQDGGASARVTGQYLAQLDVLGVRLNADLSAGQTSVAERQKLFHRFRTGFSGRTLK